MRRLVLRGNNNSCNRYMVYLTSPGLGYYAFCGAEVGWACDDPFAFPSHQGVR